MNPRAWERCPGRVEFARHDDTEIVCVDREQETAACVDALARRYHNVIFYGDRGVGKTFFVRRILHAALETEAPKALVIPFRVTSLMSYCPDDTPAAFTRAVLLAICEHLWTVCMDEDYLGLRESLSVPDGQISFAKPEKKLLRRIFKQLMLAEVSTGFETASAIGFSAAITGKRDEKRQRTLRQSQLLPFEFFAFLEEIRCRILPALGKKRIIVLCDEANLLATGDQVDILERHIDLFSDGRVQFLFVAGITTLDRRLNMPACFETTFRMDGLSARHIREILAAIAPSASVDFSSGTVERVCECFHFNTRIVLDVLREAEQLALEIDSQQITEETIEESISRMRNRLKMEEEMLRWRAPDKSIESDK